MQDRTDFSEKGSVLWLGLSYYRKEERLHLCHYCHHSSISLETKLRVYQGSVLSVLLYGSECWPISTSLCSRLSTFDTQAQRTITNTKWFDYKTNIEVRALTKRQPIQRYIAQSRLRWIGHLLRSAHIHLLLQPQTAGNNRTRWRSTSVARAVSTPSWQEP